MQISLIQASRTEKQGGKFSTSCSEREIFYLPLGRQPAIFSLKGLKSAVPLPCREPRALKSPECFGKIAYRNIKPVLLKLLLKRSSRDLNAHFLLIFIRFKAPGKAANLVPKRCPEWGQLCANSRLWKRFVSCRIPAGCTYAAMTGLVFERLRVLQGQQKLPNIEYYRLSHQLTNDQWEISLLALSFQLWAPNFWETSAGIPQKWLSPTRCCSIPSARCTASLAFTPKQQLHPAMSPFAAEPDGAPKKPAPALAAVRLPCRGWTNIHSPQRGSSPHTEPQSLSAKPC